MEDVSAIPRATAPSPFADIDVVINIIMDNAAVHRFSQSRIILFSPCRHFSAQKLLLNKTSAYVVDHAEMPRGKL